MSWMTPLLSRSDWSRSSILHRCLCLDLVKAISQYWIMITVTIHEAKTHLSRLIREVLLGEEVVIAKGKKPVVKIIPLEAVNKNRKIGPAPGIISFIAENFDQPLDDFSA